jgi:hypothetical protein
MEMKLEFELELERQPQRRFQVLSLFNRVNNRYPIVQLYIMQYGLLFTFHYCVVGRLGRLSKSRLFPAPAKSRPCRPKVGFSSKIPAGRRQNRPRPPSLVIMNILGACPPLEVDPLNSLVPNTSATYSSIP